MIVEKFQLYTLVILLGVGTAVNAQDFNSGQQDEVFKERARIEREFHTERALVEMEWHRERAQELEEQWESGSFNEGSLLKTAKEETKWYKKLEREAREHERKLRKLDNEFHLQLAKVEAEWFSQRAEEAMARAKYLRQQEKDRQFKSIEWHKARRKDQYHWHMDRAKRAAEHAELVERAMTDL